MGLHPLSKWRRHPHDIAKIDRGLTGDYFRSAIASWRRKACHTAIPRCTRRPAHVLPPGNACFGIPRLTLPVGRRNQLWHSRRVTPAAAERFRRSNWSARLTACSSDTVGIRSKTFHPSSRLRKHQEGVHKTTARHELPPLDLASTKPSYRQASHFRTGIGRQVMSFRRCVRSCQAANSVKPRRVRVHHGIRRPSAGHARHGKSALRTSTSSLSLSVIPAVDIRGACQCGESASHRRNAAAAAGCAPALI